jgi:hypothetical protein
MATEKKKESEKPSKQKYGDYNNDGKRDSFGAYLRDLSDGGGRGGSGASYSNLNNADYQRAGGNPYQDGATRSGWTSFDAGGKGQTQAQSPFQRMLSTGLLGMMTGGPMGAITSIGGREIYDDIKKKGGLLNVLGMNGQPAGDPSDPMNLIAKSKQQTTPTITPEIIKVASPYAAEDLAMSQQVLPYGPQPMPQPMPLSTMGQIPPDIMATTINPAGVPFNNIDGPMGALGPKVKSNAPNGMPPRGMSDQMYSSWLRNQRGAVNVDNMTPEGLRYMYENYRNSPAFR